jgi:8-oxo-dGTP pyrophosphatase MutT (NUDIX family)
MSQKSATVAVISNSKILLLKRGNTAPWMPNRYCLVGGGVDKDESLIDCAIREASEEAGLSLDKSSLNPLTVCYNNGYSKIVFVVNATQINVVLNYEHSEYVWASYDDCMKLYDSNKLVPRLKTTIQHIRSLGLVS